ncbi:MAG: hypothetical protein ACTSRK_14625 [Promethearchaeota archaeon]
MAKNQPNPQETKEKFPFPKKVAENNILARMRTLLALERNYLAEERTQLAQFRTGIALTLFGPTSSAIYFPWSVSQNIPTWISIIIIISFTSITGIGLYWIIKASSILKNLRMKKKFVKQRELDLIEENQDVKDLLANCLDIYCDF